ncbi:MAG: hypothetical protein JSS75_07055 [Bacteroidetes bacterium]|nr:hypothetical protein [Bacteroidota bacterium]
MLPIAIVIAALLSCSSATQTTTQPTDTAECGTERWHVKSLADADTSLIDFATIHPSTVAAEIAIPKPTSPDSRLQIERDVIEVSAHLTSYKREDDGDLHLVLQDDSGQTMIAEIPSATCSPANRTSHAGQYATAAQWIKDHVGNPTSSFKTCDVAVTVRGVRFFDFIHGQRGVAVNGVEVHPVLIIQ